MFKQLKLLRISLKTHGGYIKKNNLLALFNFLIIKNSWKRRKGRFACLPRRCALGVLPLTTPASAHLHADEQWQSRKNRVRRAGRQGERKRRREDKGRRRGGGAVCWSRSIEDKKGEQAQICSTALIWRVRAAEAMLWCAATLILFMITAVHSNQCTFILQREAVFKADIMLWVEREAKWLLMNPETHRTSLWTNSVFLGHYYSTTVSQECAL